MVSLEQFSWPLRLVLFGEERYTMSTDTLRINRLTQMVRFLSTSRLFLWMLWVMYRERRRAIRAHAQSSSAAQSASEALIQGLVAFLTIQGSLHASFAELQLVVAGYTLAFAVLLVTGGRMGDLYGRKRVFVLGMAGFTLFSGCCGLAPNALSLIVFRIVQGAAAALMFPQVVSFIQVSFEQAERSSGSWMLP